MPEHDPTRTDRLALYMRARAAEKAAHDDAVRVVERWNAAVAAGRGALWSPTTRCALIAGTPWLGGHAQCGSPDSVVGATGARLVLVPRARRPAVPSAAKPARAS